MNNNRRSSALRGSDFAVESRLAGRLAGALTVQAQSQPHDVAERLRAAREQALACARESRLAANATAVPAATVVGFSSSGIGVLGGFTPWWQRLAAVLPLVLLVSGLVAIDQWSIREEVVAAADLDAQLLADDLPPAAFSDPGFAEYLRSAPPP